MPQITALQLNTSDMPEKELDRFAAEEVTTGLQIRKYGIGFRQ